MPTGGGDLPIIELYPNLISVTQFPTARRCDFYCAYVVIYSASKL